MDKYLKLIYSWLIQNQLQKEAQKVNSLINNDFDSETQEEHDFENRIDGISKDTISEIPSSFHAQVSEFENIARKEGFKILDTGERSAYISHGGFGIVFRGIYQGKPAVIKIIKKESFVPSEIDNWKNIINAANTNVPSLKNYIPKIYKLNSDENYEIIIMEELYKIHPYLLKKMEKIPSSYSGNPDDISSDVFEEPGFNKLIEALIELYDNTGISWGDLNHNNLMADRDGNLKIIDVGLYYAD